MPTVLPEAKAVPQPEKSEFRLTGFHVLATLVAFFGIVAGVNVVMIRYALTTHSGEVTAHPYEKGLAYNSAIREAREQEARGWKVDGQATRSADGRKAQIEASDRRATPSGSAAALERWPAGNAPDRHGAHCWPRPPTSSATMRSN